MTIAAAVKSALNAVGAYRTSIRHAPFPGVAVLVYHAIRRDDSPAWAMAHDNLHVTAEHFDAHCSVIRRMCTPITVGEFHDIATGRMLAPPAAVLVTFDDGYRSVLTEALPILERWQIPATLFVCPGPIERQQRFWFDVADRHASAEPGPMALAEWRRFIADTATPAAAGDPHAPLTIDELRTLHRHPLFSIGAHTVTHPRLAELSADGQREEINGCQQMLTEWLDAPVRWFAYPEGRPGVDYTDETIRLVAEAGFDECFAVGENFTRPLVMRFGQLRFTVLQSTSGSELAHRLAVSYPRDRPGSPVGRALHEIKVPVLRALSGLSGQHPVLLPRQAEVEDGIADIRGPYRVAGRTLAIQFLERAAGTLAAVYAPRGGEPWSSELLPYRGPAALEFELPTGNLRWDGRAIGSVSGGERIAPRRFEWRFTIRTDSGQTLSRVTSHYVAREEPFNEPAYLNGEGFVDNEAASAAVHASVLGLAREHGAVGPTLEIGCANGSTLAALHHAGLDGYGIDISAWAVAAAAQRLGPGRVWQCNPERDGFPAALRAKGPFGLIVMTSVLEHFHHPLAALESLRSIAAPSAVLIVVTTNANSLGHLVFGPDWEGFVDWSHHGVEQITPSALNAWLAAAGWTTVTLRTWHLWDSSADPVHASVREWFRADARMRRLLDERNLGDFISCVARFSSQPPA